MKRKILSLLPALLLLGSPAFAAELVHNPVLSAAAGQDLPITAVLAGADKNTRVRLHYRVKGKEIFKSVEMGGSPTEISATVPGKSVSSEGLEYYIEATQGPGQAVASSPETNAKANPHFVTVRKDESAPEVTALSPMEGSESDSSQPVITAAFADADSGIDTGSLSIKVDGVEVSDLDEAQVFDTMVSYLPSKPLADGNHEVVVAIRDKAGNPGSVKVSFSVKASAGFEVKKEARKFRWNGSLNYSTQYAHLLSSPKNTKSALPYRPYGVNRGRLEVTGRGEETVLRLKVSKTDEERSDQQPSDRYLASISNDQGLIAIGDFSPNFSELSLYNLYLLRGVTMDLRSGSLSEGHTRLIGVWGQTQRPIELGVSAFTGTPGPATFGQHLYGARWEFGSKYFQMGLNTVTVNDDPDSVKNPGGQTPKFTWVNTTDIEANITPIYLRLFGEAGVDYYANGPTILGLNVGSSYRAGLDWNVLPWGTQLTFDFKDLGGNLPFLPLPGGYTTMANPGLTPDYRGYESSLSQSLMDGQVSASLNYNKWRDNLLSSKPTTTDTEFFSGNLGLYFNAMPYLNLGYNKNSARNDGSGNTTAGSFYQNMQSDSLNATLGYTHALSDTRSLSGNISYINTKSQDLALLRSSQDLTSSTYSVSAFLNLGTASFSASGSFGASDAPTLFPAVTASGVTMQARTGASNSVMLRWNQQWKPRVVDTYLGWDFSANSADAPAVDTFAAQSSSGSRSTISLGGNYTPNKDHRLGLAFAQANVATSSKVAAISSDDSLVQLYSSLTYNYNF